jgi:hypothetical protein
MFLDFMQLAINPFEGYRADEIPYIKKQSFKRMLECWNKNAEFRKEQEEQKAKNFERSKVK